MASYRSRIQHQRAKWQLIFLIPSWVLQLGLTFGMAGLFAWRLGDTWKHYEDRQKKGELPVVEVVWHFANAVLSFVSGICTFAEIARYLAESLTPWTMLFTNVVKLTCALAVMALDIAVLVDGKVTRYPLISVGLDGVLIIASLAFAVHAIIKYRRLSKYDDHAHDTTARGYGYEDGLGRENSYSSRRGLRESFDKRISVPSIRSLSTTPDETPLQDIERRPSYNHKRDTQFEDYLARRSSTSGLTPDAATTIPGEYMWPTVSQDEPHEETGLTTGTVKTHLRVDSMARAPSWASDHVLVSVPEEEDEHVERKSQEETKDRDALLGKQRTGSEDSMDRPRVSQDV